jgi:CelD/BcsL family acetyltransferase involved in cellulose biosynthesis
VTILSSVLISDIASLRGERRAWEDLLARSSENEPTLGSAWLLAWWDVFGSEGERELRSLAFYDGDRLVGFAPLLLRRHVYRPGIPFRRLEMLGSGELESDETCADYLGVIAEKGREADVASAFAAALASNVAGGWDELVLSSMNGDGVLPSLLRAALRARGLHVDLEEWSTAPYVALPNSWDAYLAALKSSKRAQLRKSLRAFEAWAGGPPVLTRVRSLSELAEGRRVLMALHRERWGSDGVFGSAKFRAFHDLVMPELLALGALDLGWMSVRGEPVAAFYNLRWNGKLHFYQSGRRLDVPDDVRIGLTMHAYLIKDAIEAGLREYDFLAGASQYKMALALATRPLVKLRAARVSIVETARRASVRAYDQGRRLRGWARARDLSRAPPRIKAILEKLLTPGGLRR